MSTKIGIGYSNQTDSLAAGREAATSALLKAQVSTADFALLFCSGKHDAYAFMEGVVQILGDIPKVGGSCIGIITDDFLGYEGFEVGVTVFSSDTLTFKVFSQHAINLNERQAGVDLGKKIKDGWDSNDNGLLIFYDSSKQQNPPLMNFGTYLFEGIEEHLPKSLTCAGGGFLSDMKLSTCYQFFRNEVSTQTAVAVLIGNCKMEVSVMHGCKPCSSYLKVTKAEGPVIFEIDDRPALEVIDTLLGENHGIQWKDFSCYITLGVNKGEKFGTFNEKEYANRLTLAVDEQNKAMIMFEPDLKVGDDVQLMRRSVDLMYIKENVQQLFDKVDGFKPVFAFYINCAGRAKPYAGLEFEDAEEVQKCIRGVPLMGFYSGVEIAKVGNNLQPLDWTGVLCMIAE
jgi:hypothetical protein